MTKLAQAVNFSQLEDAIGITIKASDPAKGLTLGDIVNALIPSLFIIAGLVLLLYLIWGGYTYMLSRGDEKATALGKERITNAIVGFVIIFVAFWLVRLVGLVLGIKQFGELF